MDLSDEHWRAAIKQATRNSGVRLKTWWDRYIKVKEFYDEKGEYNKITLSLTFWDTFAQSVRQAKKKGALSNEQLAALKKINFPYEKLTGGYELGENAKKHTPLGLALEFQKKFNDAASDPQPTKEERAAQAKRISYLRTQYANGSIGEKTAQKLGITS